jgi:hypothetical protein
VQLGNDVYMPAAPTWASEHRGGPRNFENRIMGTKASWGFPSFLRRQRVFRDGFLSRAGLLTLRYVYIAPCSCRRSGHGVPHASVIVHLSMILLSEIRGCADVRSQFTTAWSLYAPKAPNARVVTTLRLFQWLLLHVVGPSVSRIYVVFSTYNGRAAAR